MKDLHVSEFLEILQDSPREWVIDLSGGIGFLDPKCKHRSRNGEEKPRCYICPWVYVLDQVGEEFAVYRNEKHEAVPMWYRIYIDRSEIWNAADGKPAHNPKIRRALLEACAIRRSIEPGTPDRFRECGESQ